MLPWSSLTRSSLTVRERTEQIERQVLSERATWINGANIPVDGAQGRPSAF